MTIRSKPSTGQDANQSDAFGTSTGSRDIIGPQTRSQTVNPISPPPRFETRLQTASPVSPLRGFGGLWGDFDTRTSLPDVPLTREPPQLSRPTSLAQIGSNVKEYVRNVRSRGNTPNASPAISSHPSPDPTPQPSPSEAPIELERRRPHTKVECLTGFVFPPLTRSSRICGLYGPDAVASFAQLDDRKLQIQHHSGLAPLLLRQLDAVRGIPKIPRMRSPEGTNKTHAKAAKQYASSIDNWMRAESHMVKLAGSRFKDDIEAAETWRYYLGQAVNKLVEERDTFRPDCEPRHQCAWEVPPRAEAEHRLHDWFAWSSPHDKPSRPVAMLTWRMEATAFDFDTLYRSAVRRVPPDWLLDIKYPGFEITVCKDQVAYPEGMTWEASLLALLAWQGLHHYGIRWAIIFNGETAMITYLAKSTTMFVSKPFGRAGERGLTLASALFALAVMDHESDTNRPLYTIRNGHIDFYSRPTRSHVRELWAEACAKHDWAARDAPLYKEREMSVIKEEPEVKKECE
ncbi:hypothetical protein CspHIS471_0108850 [Cutaneotrichosporon sp. HIS471]|nr:hypothetical protein CspHIS471_0108850 [Cutaneotrichosporon sp. HIS471]